MKPLAGIARARQRHTLQQAHVAPRPNSRWRLTRRLASNGQLDLFRAAAAGDLGPGCYVVKAPRRQDDPLASALLRREIVVSDGVGHQNLVSVLNADYSGRDAHAVLPYLEGATLRQLMVGRMLDVSLTLAIARQTASALAALHAGGWLHGQVRPEHVLVSPQGQATLIDLTQSRRLESTECDVQAGAPLAASINACLLYSAPEHFASRKRLTAASDTYSLGAMLFEALTGEPLFADATGRELMICHQRVAAPDVRHYRAELSLEIAELVRRMLAKEPLRRPSDEELVRWLAELEIEELAL